MSVHDLNKNTKNIFLSFDMQNIFGKKVFGQKK